MRESAQREYVNAGLCFFGDIIERDVAGGLCYGSARYHFGGTAHLLTAHVIEHNNIRTAAQRLGDLLEISCFHLDFYCVAELFF